jgi:hypothetical protein
MPLNKLSAIFDAYPEIDVSYIITGKTSHRNHVDHNVEKGAENEKAIFLQKDALGKYRDNQGIIFKIDSMQKLVPVYEDIIVSAGNLTNQSVNETYTENFAYLDKIHPDIDAVLRVNGVSMEPVVKNGSFVGLKLIDEDNWDYLSEHRYYVVLTADNERYCKYLKIDQDMDCITLISRNEDFNDIVFPRKHIVKIWALKFIISFF